MTPGQSLHAKFHFASLALLLSLALSAVLQAQTSTLTWKQLRPKTALPPRAAFATAFDPISNKVVIFGGHDATQFLGETWTFDGTTWEQVTTAVAPPPRAAAAMAYDTRTHKIVLFGGFINNTILNDTWIWDGSTASWTQANPKTVPVGATNAMLFDDPASGRVEMFGGYQGMFYSRTMWLWTGSNWRKLNPATTPYPRSGAVVVNDPIHKNVVLFGGISDNWIVQNTWTWDGTNWTQRKVKQPPPLYFTTGAFDPVRKQVLVFGGGSQGVDQNSTWAWTGGIWKQLTPAKNPARRELFGTVWNPTTQQFVIFGGDVFQTTKFYGDTWQLTTQ